jgi:hypothetical protein
MKCAICGIEIDSIDEAIDEGWIPYAWEGNQEREGPFCGACSEIFIQIRKNDTYVLKEEYIGKIIYQDSDFLDEEPQDNGSTGVIIEYCDN